MLVHRESEEYNTSDVEENLTPSDIRRPPEIKISPGSDENYPGMCVPESIVKIMVESPKDPPQVDYAFPSIQPVVVTPVEVIADRSAEEGEDLTAIKIDVNMPVDTTNIFYDYEEPVGEGGDEDGSPKQS